MSKPSIITSKPPHSAHQELKPAEALLVDQLGDVDATARHVSSSPLLRRQKKFIPPGTQPA